MTDFLQGVILGMVLGIFLGYVVIPIMVDVTTRYMRTHPVRRGR